MSDLTPPPDDELVSAALDGVATPEERARIDADPRLSDRLTELGRVHQLVAEPVVPLDEVTARRQLDQALSILDESTASAATASAMRTTSAAGPAPSHRRNQLAPKVLSIAAVVLVALLALPLVASLGGDDDGDQSADMATSGDAVEESATMAAGSDEGGSADGADQGDRPDDDADTDTADALQEMLEPGAYLAERTLPYLGTLATAEEAAAAARSGAEAMIDNFSTTPSSDTEGGGQERSDLVCPIAPVGDRLVLETSAEVGGRELLVRVWAIEGMGAAGPDLVTEAIDVNTCEVVGRFGP
ncbi:MAG: hypothetical protein JJE52_00700 [Acidimicrobiia bacterium]|nr:hypothetical protein [Acidimicrobiia bacterium]